MRRKMYWFIGILLTVSIIVRFVSIRDAGDVSDTVLERQGVEVVDVDYDDITVGNGRTPEPADGPEAAATDEAGDGQMGPEATADGAPTENAGDSGIGQLSQTGADAPSAGELSSLGEMSQGPVDSQPAAVEPVAPQGGEAPVQEAPVEGDGSEGVPGGDDAPAAEAQPEVTATPEPVDETPVVVPFGESYTLTTEIDEYGFMPTAESPDGPFEPLSFTLTMREYLLPADFESRYGDTYKLSGTEAGAGFELVLNDYTGSAVVIPQNALVIGMESVTGETEQPGYQLMDAEISGNIGVMVETNVPIMLYKRYEYSAEGEPMKYMAVTTYNEGRESKVLFDLGVDVPEGAPVADASQEPAMVYETLQKGAKGDAVRALQARLILLGYLSGQADGDFGNMTDQAIRKAQASFGMEQTGIADDAFQQRLFADVDQNP